MKNMRRWQLDHSRPSSIYLTADARLSSTNYVDDQVWQLEIGQGESPALVLQTQYGGRVGLARILPMWIVNQTVIYQAQEYDTSPIIQYFGPNYMQTQSKITPSLSLVTHTFVLDSQSLAGLFVLENQSDEALSIHLDLLGQIANKHTKQASNIVTFPDGIDALHLGEIGNINPIIYVENGQAELETGSATSAKIGTTITLEPTTTKEIRWVHTGYTTIQESLRNAEFWMQQDWQFLLQQIDVASSAIPTVQMGNKDWDALIDSSYNRLVQSFLSPTNQLPSASFVADRTSKSGYSSRGDGTDHNRQWNGQDPLLAYFITSAITTIHPEWAKGVIQNYLHTQQEDGWIDGKPGLGGQRQEYLCMPILAKMAWNIYKQTEDETFITDIFDGLHRFLHRWLENDYDKDADGLPEWQSEQQMGYTFFPMFARGQGWAQEVDIRTVESPDLLTYLLGEAINLQKIAHQLGKKSEAKSLETTIQNLSTKLDMLWNGKQYQYRDRDTHLTQSSIQILEDGRGDEEQLLALSLDEPRRLQIQISGGVSHEPKIELIIRGKDWQGNDIIETADSSEFAWQSRHGKYTNKHAFLDIDSVLCKGLSRVYRINIKTVDTTKLDITALMPLWIKHLPDERAKILVKLLKDKKHFWRPNGFTMASIQDEHQPLITQDKGGTIWFYWLTLIGEGLLEHGYRKEVATVLKNILKMQTQLVQETGQFSQFYHSDDSKGFGVANHLGGIVPLGLLLQVLGIRILSSEKVWVGGEYVWGRGVTIRQHGVTIRRSNQGTKVKFPSGYQVELDKDAEWQAITDPNPVELPKPTAFPKNSDPRVKHPQKGSITVQYE